jgi:hypothetical protein
VLRFRAKISRRAAHDLILTIVRHGNHTHPRNFPTDAAIRRQFARGNIDFDRLVQECRSPGRPVPGYENMVGSTLFTLGEAEVSLVDAATGEADTLLTGQGLVALSNYWATFESARENIQRAVTRTSLTDFHSAVVSGIASIEGYINSKAAAWNQTHPDDQLVDSKEAKVSFEEKVDVWLPKVTGGRRLEKGGAEWRHFLILRAIRDKDAVHPKAIGIGVSYTELAKNINLFRLGIAGLLFQLHRLFSESVPAAVIRAMYAPEVEAVEGPTE